MSEPGLYISIDQKIQIMTLAFKTGIGLGDSSASIDTTISNYDKMVAAIGGTRVKETPDN